MSHPEPPQKFNQPWSGTNRIPNIKEFVSRLDKDKATRDKEIDAENQTAGQNSSVVAHKNEPPPQGKTVTDPVTGKPVIIADVGKEFMKNVDNPQVPHFRDLYI
jgi:hypothetical protein